MTSLNRWFAFVMVGALGFTVQTLALVTMTRGAGVHYLVATAVAVEIAVLHNFLWHERWTWRDRPASGGRQRLTRLGTFHLTNGFVSIGGNLIVVALLVRAVRSNVVLASLVGMAVTAALNYLASDRLVFGTPRWVQALTSLRTSRAAMVALLIALPATAVSAADPRPETIEAWTKYARAVEARIARERLAGTRPGLSPDLISGEADVTDGDIVGVPNGLIHHWRGRILLPGVTLEQMLASIDSPDRTAKRQDDVLEARVLERDGNRMRLYLKVSRKSLITVTYNTEYAVEKHRDSSRSAWSRSIATRIAELADAGTPQEREKPEGRDCGFLWRLNAYWRYTQIDRSVLVELETISLSRGIPLGLGPIVRPIIGREARQSLAKTLVAVRAELAAVTTGAAVSGPANRLRQGSGGPPKPRAKAEAGHYR